jgi:hypothetical protein
MLANCVSPPRDGNVVYIGATALNLSSVRQDSPCTTRAPSPSSPFHVGGDDADLVVPVEPHALALHPRRPELTHRIPILSRFELLTADADHQVFDQDLTQDGRAFGIDLRAIDAGDDRA